MKKSNDFQPPKISDIIIQAICICGWFAMVSIDTFGWNFLIAYLLVVIGFAFWIYCAFVSKRRLFFKKPSLSIFVILFISALALTKFIEVKKADDDAYLNLSITINQTSDTNPLKSVFELTNNGKNEILFEAWSTHFNSTNFSVWPPMKPTESDSGMPITLKIFQDQAVEINELLNHGETKSIFNLSEIFSGSLGKKPLVPIGDDLVIFIQYRITLQPWLVYKISKRFINKHDAHSFTWYEEPKGDTNRDSKIDWNYFCRIHSNK